MGIVISLLAGSLFGLGLLVSGMADPAKVLGFLDFAGTWDPSLAFVMAGAICVGLPAFQMAARRETTVLGRCMNLPAAKRIDWQLLLGSAIFGTGWGLAGICPGPGFVLLGIDAQQGGVFLAALLAGMTLFEIQQSVRGRAIFSRIYRNSINYLFHRRKRCTR